MMLFSSWFNKKSRFLKPCKCKVKHQWLKYFIIFLNVVEPIIFLGFFVYLWRFISQLDNEKIKDLLLDDPCYIDAGISLETCDRLAEEYTNLTNVSVFP